MIGGCCKGHLHVIRVGHLPLFVGHDGEIESVPTDLLDVIGPALMAIDSVGAQAQQLDAALVKLGLEASHLAQLSSADRGEVLGMGEEDNPAVTNILVQVDGALGGVGLKVGGDGTQAEARGRMMLVKGICAI